MINIPHIAVFRSDDQFRDEIARLLTRYQYQILKVLSPNEILKNIETSSRLPDTILIPFKLEDATSGLKICLQIKTTPQLNQIPIIMFCASEEEQTLEACYSAGADVVFKPNIQAAHLYSQILSLTRLNRDYQERLNYHYEETGFRTSTISAFNNLKEGILILNKNQQTLFANRAFRLMLGVNQIIDKPNYELISPQLSIVAEQFIAMVQDHVNQKESVSFYESELKRIDGQTFPAALRISIIYGQNQIQSGFSIAVSDLTEILELSSLLLQSERTRSLGLITTCGARKVFASNNLGSPTAPISSLTKLLDSEDCVCLLSKELTSLLEIIDMVVDPSVKLTLNEYPELKLAMRASDFFQLFGHLILHVTEQAGSGGNVEIDFEYQEFDKDLSVIISSTSKRVTPIIPDDYLTSLLRGDFTQIKNLKTAQTKIYTGLDAAQAVADKYRSYIEIKNSADNQLKIRVNLPIFNQL